MDNKQAKFILQSCRSGGQDAHDPQFGEALRQAQRDPELGAWFDEEQARDDAVRRKLKEVPVPADLAGLILAVRAGEAPSRTPRRQAMWAIAAALLALGTVTAILLGAFKGARPLAEYRAEMVQMVSSGIRFDFRSEDLSEVEGWLATNHPWADSVIPAGLKDVPALGCRSFAWRGQPVALLCFLPKQGGAVHLLVVSRSALRDAPAAQQRVFAAEGNWLTASWAEGEKVYLVAARTSDRAYLERFL
jgi:hypothetical protein